MHAHGPFEATPDFSPATGPGRALKPYDAVLALTMRERTFRSRLIAQQLADPPGERPLKVADVGCGTGTLAIALAESGAELTAIDADPRILELALAKPGATAVRWTHARTEDLPLEGKTRRAIDIREGEEIDAPAFTALIRAAVAHHAG